MSRVIGSEHVDAARAKGRVVLEVLPGDIVTDMAVETAARVGIRLVEGPLEKPSLPRTDGNTAMRRALTRRAPRWVAPSAAAGRQPHRFGKLALVGAGGVGANVAHLAANADMADEIYLIDVAPGILDSAWIMSALIARDNAGVTEGNRAAPWMPRRKPPGPRMVTVP